MCQASTSQPNCCVIAYQPNCCVIAYQQSSAIVIVILVSHALPHCSIAISTGRWIISSRSLSDFNSTHNVHNGESYDYTLNLVPESPFIQYALQ